MNDDIYFEATIQTRFGMRTPYVEDVLNELRAAGEKIVPHGAAEANRLGLTTQVPVREIYLTSGRSRRLHFGARVVELRNAPERLLQPGRDGQIVRARDLLGPR